MVDSGLQTMDDTMTKLKKVDLADKENQINPNLATIEQQTEYPVEEREKDEPEEINLGIPKLNEVEFKAEYGKLDQHEQRMKELRDQQDLLEKMASEDDQVHQMMQRQENQEYEAYLARQLDVQNAEKDN